MTVPSLIRLAAVCLFVTFTVPAAVALEVVDRLRASGAILHELGVVDGLAGYWVEPASGGGWPLYVTTTGHAIAGLLHDASGRLLTAEQIARLAAPPKRVEEAIAQASLHLGAVGRDVVIFADPACSFSRTTVARFAMAALEGHLVLHVVPVALPGLGSAGMARAVIAADDPVGAWFARPGDGPASTQDDLDANNRLFADLGGEAVPLVMRADGTLHEGAISRPLDWLGGSAR